MKSILNKIFFGVFITVFMNGCHTFDHQNIFLETIKKNQKQNLVNKEDKVIKTTNNNIDKKKISKKTEMAPINAPKQKEKVKTVTLNKKINLTKNKKFQLSIIKNWSEKKLIKEMGLSDFIKQEGKLKNFQYHFDSCYLDIFLIKKKNGYFVTYIETRSTKLYGEIKTKKCLIEIKNKFKNIS